MTGGNQKAPLALSCRDLRQLADAALYMLRGSTVSDAPLIIGSLDPYSPVPPDDRGRCA